MFVGSRGIRETEIKIFCVVHRATLELCEGVLRMGHHGTCQRREKSKETGENDAIREMKCVY
jgi:hypothetical protein